METANKEQAMVCLRKAEKARDAGDLDKARRMAEKSLKLYLNDNQKAKGEGIEYRAIFNITFVFRLRIIRVVYSTDFLSELENCREAGEGRGGDEGVRQRQRAGCREEEEEEEEESGGEGEIRANYTPEQREAVEGYREKTRSSVQTLLPYSH